MNIYWAVIEEDPCYSNMSYSRCSWIEISEWVFQVVVNHKSNSEYAFLCVTACGKNVYF